MRDYFIPSTKDGIINALSKYWPEDIAKFKKWPIKRLMAVFCRLRDADIRPQSTEMPLKCPRKGYNK
jgi:hypothetical protein